MSLSPEQLRMLLPSLLLLPSAAISAIRDFSSFV